MLIPCPYCGPRDQAEFVYERDGPRPRPGPEADPETWADFVFLRDNPEGARSEVWQHLMGCRRFLRVVRCTRTHAIHSVTDVNDLGGEVR